MSFLILIFHIPWLLHWSFTEFSYSLSKYLVALFLTKILSSVFAKCTQVHDLAIKFCSAVSPKSSQEVFFVFLFFKEFNNCSTFSLKKNQLESWFAIFFLSKSSGTSAKISSENFTVHKCVKFRFCIICNS